MDESIPALPTPSNGLTPIQKPSATPLLNLYRAEFRTFAASFPEDEFLPFPPLDRAVAIANLRTTALNLMETKKAILRPTLNHVADLLAAEYDGCIHWSGDQYDNGCGSVGAAPQRGWIKTSAHKRVLEIAVGFKIPKGFQCDHICHSPETCTDRSECTHVLCVNPEHFEAVSA
ncbi:hypothetical protein [Arthrobacter sp. UYCo732]|uniref:hypothetical protein n=1 Tax=Arthrobacter sp. UYCo732 TaxID=3156336 RepID=UPI003399F5F7